VAIKFLRFALWVLLAAATCCHAAVIDAKKSSAEFTIHPRLPIPSQGRFESVSGALQALPEQQSRVEVQVDARKLSFKGPLWLGRMARSKEFLDAENHPYIQFVSQAFSRDLLEKGGELKGQLSLRGQTEAVSFHIEKPACTNPGYDCELVVNGTVKRRAFGMQAYRFSIKDEVDFEFRIRLLAESAK
jgi:polyisoprenoid-binding protein YceI